MEIKVDVTRGMKSAYVGAPFDEAKEALENEGYELISLEQMAQLRIQEGKDSFISQNGNRTREGFLYVPKKGIFLTKKSPIMASAKKATDCHRNNKDFYPTPKQVEKALADSCKVANKEINKEIPTLRLSEEELTAYAFGSQAKAYGKFLKEAGIDTLRVYTINMQDKPFATQAWLRWLVSGSELDGNDGGWDRDLANDDRARGVQKATAEGGSQKIKTPSLQDILKFSEAYVSSAAKPEFEKGLKSLYK